MENKYLKNEANHLFDMYIDRYVYTKIIANPISEEYEQELSELKSYFKKTIVVDEDILKLKKRLLDKEKIISTQINLAIIDYFEYEAVYSLLFLIYTLKEDSPGLRELKAKKEVLDSILFQNEIKGLVKVMRNC